MSVRLPASERREQLLGIALERFAHDGFHATSMNDIAEAAGVTKPVLYQHFASKRQLYRELLADQGQQLRESIAKATADSPSPRAQVEQGMAAYFVWVKDHRQAFRLLFGSGVRRDEEFGPDVRAVEQAIADSVTELINVDATEQHRQLLAMGIIGIAEGASRQLVQDDEPFDPQLLARQVSDFAWSGLRGIRRVDH